MRNSRSSFLNSGVSNLSWWCAEGAGLLERSLGIRGATSRSESFARGGDGSVGESSNGTVVAESSERYEPVSDAALTSAVDCCCVSWSGSTSVWIDARSQSGAHTTETPQGGQLMVLSV